MCQRRCLLFCAGLAVGITHTSCLVACFLFVSAALSVMNFVLIVFSCSTFLSVMGMFFVLREWCGTRGRLFTVSSYEDEEERRQLSSLRQWGGSGRWVLSHNPLYASLSAALRRARRPLPELPVTSTTEEEEELYDHLYASVPFVPTAETTV